MNSEESFTRYVVGDLRAEFIDHQNIKVLIINNYVDMWVASGYVEITVPHEESHEIRLTELGKSRFLMGKL